MGDRTTAYRVWWGNLRGSDRMEDPGIDGKIILKWIFKVGLGGGACTGLTWLRTRTGDELL
jgi:hypothetical protein